MVVFVCVHICELYIFYRYILLLVYTFAAVCVAVKTGICCTKNRYYKK